MTAHPVRIRCIYYSKLLFEVLINDSNEFLFELLINDTNYSKFLFEVIINDSNETEIINLGEKW